MNSSSSNCSSRSPGSHLSTKSQRLGFSSFHHPRQKGGRFLRPDPSESPNHKASGALVGGGLSLGLFILWGAAVGGGPYGEPLTQRPTAVSTAETKVMAGSGGGRVPWTRRLFGLALRLLTRPSASRDARPPP